MTNENQSRKGIEEMSEIGNDCTGQEKYIRSKTEKMCARCGRCSVCHGRGALAYGEGYRACSQCGGVDEIDDVVHIAPLTYGEIPVAVEQLASAVPEARKRVEELEAENKKLREALQTLTKYPKEVYMGYARIEFSKRLLPEHAQEILDLAWPKGEKG